MRKGRERLLNEGKLKKENPLKKNKKDNNT